MYNIHCILSQTYTNNFFRSHVPLLKKYTKNFYDYCSEKYFSEKNQCAKCQKTQIKHPRLHAKPNFSS